MGTPFLWAHSEGLQLISYTFLSSFFLLWMTYQPLKFHGVSSPLLFNGTLNSGIISVLKLVHKLHQENISSKKRILITLLKVPV